MKYDHKHEADFVGATGHCNCCGLDVELTNDDRPRKYISEWLVVCPHCGNTIHCKNPMKKITTLTFGD